MPDCTGLTTTLSPFSSETLTALDENGTAYENVVELKWVLLGKGRSTLTTQLLELCL